MFDLPIETTGGSVFGSEILGPYPAITLVTMSPYGPPAQGLSYLVVNVIEGFLTDHVTMEVNPTPDDGVEFDDELTG